MRIGRAYRAYYERNAYDIFYDGKLKCECFNHYELCHLLTTRKIILHNNKYSIMLKTLPYTDIVVELFLEKAFNEFVDKSYYDINCCKNMMMLYLDILKGYKHDVKNYNNIAILDSDSVSLSFGKFKTSNAKINLSLDIEAVNNTEIKKANIKDENFYTMIFDTEYGKLTIDSSAYSYHFSSNEKEMKVMSNLIYNTMLIVNR